MASKNPFTAHPREVGMNYFQHFAYAMTVTARLFGCVFACFIHAFFPFLFTHTTSRTVEKLHDELHHRVGSSEKHDS
jgi:hypothetical protein